MVAAGKYLLQQKSYGKVEDLAKKIVSKFVNFDPDVTVSHKDKKFVYATEVLSLGLLWWTFKDSIKKGDGDRVLLCWKFLMLVFKAKDHRNYCKEAIILLIHYHCVLSDRQAAQLKWGRFVNTSGRTGCNISCDLHLEHLKRRLKDMIRNLHSNVMDSAINRAAKSIGVVNQICSLFDQQNDVQPESDHHTQPGSQKDFNIVLKVLEDQRVFSKDGSRQHKSFKKIKPTLQQPSESITSWLKDRIKNYKW